MLTRPFLVCAILGATLSPCTAQRIGPAKQERQDFKLEVDLRRTPALQQGNAGTCWSFATTSFLESEVARIHGELVDLSELHTVYYTYLEKANHYVRLHGKTQFSQGGLSHDVIHIVNRHGIVPHSEYDGLLEGARGHNHSELEKMLKAMVEQVAESKRPSPQWDDAIQGVLDAYLGAVPASITVDGKSMTPVEYAHGELKLPLRSYREVMSLPSEPFWQEAQLLVPDNWMHYGGYWNMPIESMLENLDHALRSGFTIAVDLDMSERAPMRRKFVWALSDALEKPGAITDEVRQRMFDSRETTDDHLMHIVGIAHDDDGKLHYLTKNSHGNGGPWAGHVYISRNYMAAKILAFMVHEDGLTKDTVTRFDG